ncbi:MAG: F0F1 ATP synthase subunit delta [Dehalococcoidia bacterium]
MSRDVAVKRYAEAAFAIARERGTVEAWSAALELMAAAFSDPQMAAAMESARIAGADKVRLVERTLEGIDPLALNLARLLAARGRSAIAPRIGEAFQALVDEAEGVAHAQVSTAVPLSEGEREAVAGRLREITGKQVVLETEVDESIIGGLVARIGDRLIDGSTRSQLRALKRQLQEARA